MICNGIPLAKGARGMFLRTSYPIYSMRMEHPPAPLHKGDMKKIKFMFATDKTIDSLQALFTEVKHYVDLQKDYVKLDITHKLTVLLSTLILILILVVLGMIALFYLSFTLAYILEPHVGGLVNSYAIITAGILLIGVVLYWLRQRLIIQPLTNFLANLFLNDK